MFATSFKKIALAAAIVVVTASTSMAATWGWVEDGANVHLKPNKHSMIVNGVDEGQKVKIIGEYGTWLKLAIPGKDGWVRKNKISYDYPGWDDADWPHDGGGFGFGFGSSFCVADDKAHFCLGASY